MTHLVYFGLYMSAPLTGPSVKQLNNDGRPPWLLSSRDYGKDNNEKSWIEGVCFCSFHPFKEEIVYQAEARSASKTKQKNNFNNLWILQFYSLDFTWPFLVERDGVASVDNYVPAGVRGAVIGASVSQDTATGIGHQTKLVLQ